MNKPKLHLIAPAGSCNKFFKRLNLESDDAFVDFVQRTVGDSWQVTADTSLLAVQESDEQAGRTDDLQRAADIQNALADPDVRAMVTIRGGAWFTRILGHIDFDVLLTRSSPVAFFGFSELTPMVNIIGAYEMGIGLYDMGPAFLAYGLLRYASHHPHATTEARDHPPDWTRKRLAPECEKFFRDVANMLEGKPSARTIHADLLMGSMDGVNEIQMVGGNLTVLSTMVGSRYDGFTRPTGHWLMLEDFNDKIERYDRFLSHFTLANYWDKCAGILLGDFHWGETDQRASMLALLKYHLPSSWKNPVLATTDVGHTWPLSPLPLHAPLSWHGEEGGQFALKWNPLATAALD